MVFVVIRGRDNPKYMYEGIYRGMINYMYSVNLTPDVNRYFRYLLSTRESILAKDIDSRELVIPLRFLLDARDPVDNLADFNNNYYNKELKIILSPGNLPVLATYYAFDSSRADKVNPHNMRQIIIENINRTSSGAAGCSEGLNYNRPLTSTRYDEMVGHLGSTRLNIRPSYEPAPRVTVQNTGMSMVNSNSYAKTITRDSSGSIASEKEFAEPVIKLKSDEEVELSSNLFSIQKITL